MAKKRTLAEKAVELGAAVEGLFTGTPVTVAKPKKKRAKKAAKKTAKKAKKAKKPTRKAKKGHEEGQEKSQALIISHLRQVCGDFPCRKGASSF